MPKGELLMNSGTIVQYEVREVIGEIGPDIAKGLQKKFDDIMGIIKETAESVNAGLQKIDSKARPSESELKFGLKLTAGTDIYFAKAGSEGMFEIG
jgi:hypothetical protein